MNQHGNELVRRHEAGAFVRLTLVVLVLLWGAGSKAVAQGVEEDRAALMALYDATDGPNWANDTNWGTSAPLDQWFGVTTDGDGRVESLVLRDNGLRGSIPSGLEDLSVLKLLGLNHNELSGPIPSSLGNLSELLQLWLDHNELSGQIPNSLGNLSNLTWLLLYKNELSGPIPGSLGNLSNLTELQLNQNELSGPIPSSLGNLSNLGTLALSLNGLSGEIPSSLGNLSNLSRLFLSENELSGPIPDSLGNLSNLTQLWLAENNLSGPISSSFADLSNIEVLWIDSDTGLCLAEDFPLESAFGRLAQEAGLAVCETVPALPAAGALVLGALLLGMGRMVSRRRRAMARGQRRDADRRPPTARR